MSEIEELLEMAIPQLLSQRLSGIASISVQVLKKEGGEVSVKSTLEGGRIVMGEKSKKSFPDKQRSPHDLRKMFGLWLDLITSRLDEFLASNCSELTIQFWANGNLVFKGHFYERCDVRAKKITIK